MRDRGLWFATGALLTGAITLAILSLVPLSPSSPVASSAVGGPATATPEIETTPVPWITIAAGQATLTAQLASLLPTSTRVPMRTATPHPWCDTVRLVAGTECRMPAPNTPRSAAIATVAPTPTLPTCYSPQAEPGRLCTVRDRPATTPIAER